MITLSTSSFDLIEREILAECISRDSGKEFKAEEILHATTKENFYFFLLTGGRTYPIHREVLRQLAEDIVQFTVPIGKRVFREVEEFLSMEDGQISITVTLMPDEEEVELSPWGNPILADYIEADIFVDVEEVYKPSAVLAAIAEKYPHLAGRKIISKRLNWLKEFEEF